MDNDAWFAGFTDGEGSFQIMKAGPRFGVILRADDLAVLEQIRAVFGGTHITIRTYDPEGSGGKRQPTVGWMVVSKHDLRRLVGYFDRFPLRAKKARDYAIWRAAVEIYCTKGQSAPELAVLKAALVKVRAYPDQTPVPAEPTKNRALATHCPRGHPYAGDNLYTHGGRRYCRRCRTEQRRACDRRQAVVKRQVVPG